MVTIKDVAKQAGVSPGTVSKVMQNYDSISDETKQKVTKAVAKLGYVPNAMASNLSKRNFNRIGLLIKLNKQQVAQSIDEINMHYILGSLNSAKKLNIDVSTKFFNMFEDMNADELITYFRSQTISTLVIFGISKDDTVLHEIIDRQVFKVVVVDAKIQNEMTSCVMVDSYQAQYDIAKKYIQKYNTKDILYISGSPEGYVTEYRLNAMKQIEKDLGINLTVKNGMFSEAEAQTIVAENYLNKDMIICASDLMAIGAKKALLELDLFMPILGFDGILLLSYVASDIPSIKQDFYKVAYEAIKEADSLMKDNPSKVKLIDYTMTRS